MSHPFLALAMLACLATACAAPTEVLRRSLVGQQVEQRGCAQTIVGELEVRWQSTTVHLTRCERCGEVTTEEWEVVRGNKGNGMVAGIVGGLAVVAPAYLLLTAIQPAPKNGGSIDAAGTLVSVAVCIGVSALGSLAGRGLLKLYEKASEVPEVRLEPKDLAMIDKTCVPIDGVVELGPRRWTTEHAQLQLPAAALLSWDLAALRLEGEPVRIADASLAVAGGCVRAGVSRMEKELTDVALEAALADARQCFEGGVKEADPAYTRLLREQLRRKDVR